MSHKVRITAMDVSLHSIKRHLAEATRQGTGHILASVLLWGLFAVLPFIPDKVIDKPLVYVLGAIVSYPLALMLGSLFRIQAFPRDNPLSSFYLLASALQLPFVSILFATYLTNPDMLPWYSGIICSVQFLLIAWLFDSSAYLFCALGTLEVSTIIGWIAPGHAYLITPACIVLVLLISGYFLRSTSAMRHSGSDSLPGH